MCQKADKGMTIRLVILNDTSCKCLKKVHLKFKTYNGVCGIKMGKYPSRDTATYRTSTRFRIMKRG